jgi:hypothetical protein
MNCDCNMPYFYWIVLPDSAARSLSTPVTCLAS